MNHILSEKRGRVTLITIDRPERMNALDFETNQQLIRTFEAFEADPDAYVAVVTGSGDKAFCAGGDLKDFTLQYARLPAPEFRRIFIDGPGFGGITRNFKGSKPVVAAINGYCVSGGLEFALAADIRFCSPNAQFGLQDVKWGFHPADGASIRLPLVVGLGNAMEILLSGERIDAEHALRIGLVNRIYPQAELLAKTLEYAEMLATRAPLAQRFAKDVVTRAVGMHMEEALRMEARSFYDLAHTEDLREGVTSFAEKRAPKFRGK
jgi:enoyl-CoA hydratase/carnithine racemase